MRPSLRIWTVALLSLVFTYLFFIEYLPPVRRVHIPFDLEGYHYPLDDYAFQQIRAHRFPAWDADVYCGMSLAGNPQVALFYPPMWLVFLANRHQPWLRYATLEHLQFAHIWLGFLLCFLWLLRSRRLGDLACAFGGGIFAFSGYPMLQLQHLGLLCAYAWFPLGLWSIDEASEARSWRPLWKLAVASAMCFLAGYPPAWFVFAILMGVYALCRAGGIKIVFGAALAIGYSLLIAMVQAWPSWEMSSLRTPGVNYGLGSLARPDLWAPYIIPNFFDFALSTPVEKNPGGEILYLGIPALFGLFLFVRYGKWKAQLPMLALGAASFILLTNPFGVVWAVVRHSGFLSQICRAWYFLCGITIAVAALAAAGIDQFLRNEPKKLLKNKEAWIAPAGLAALAAVCLRESWIWLRGGAFRPGWAGAIDPALLLAAFSVAMLALRSAPRSTAETRRRWMAVALLVAAGIDYKVFGTSKRLNAAPGNPDFIRRHEPHPGLSDALFAELKSHAGYRIALDFDAPEVATMRDLGLATPQGRDPLVSQPIHDVLGDLNSAGFGVIDPARHDLLRLLGVRYYITSKNQPAFARLAADPMFRQIQSPAYYQVFELGDAQPGYYWEQPQPSSSVRALVWTPENRAFDVFSPAGGRFVLVEQLYPGWQANIDGKPAPISRWHEAFQAIDVPAGAHRVDFAFRPSSIRYGAAISVASIFLLVGALAATRKGPFGLQLAPIV